MTDDELRAQIRSRIADAETMHSDALAWRALRYGMTSGTLTWRADTYGPEPTERTPTAALRRLKQIAREQHRELLKLPANRMLYLRNRAEKLLAEVVALEV